MRGFTLSMAVILGIIWILASFNGCEHHASADDVGGPQGDWMAQKKAEFVKYVISTELDLTDDQKGELNRIAQDLSSRHEAMRSVALAFKKDLTSELSKNEISSEDLIAIVQRHEPAMNEMLDVLAEKMYAFHAMLTPDQRAALAAHLKERADGGCPFSRRFSGVDNAWVREKKLDIMTYMISSELDLTDDQKGELNRIAQDLSSRHDAMQSLHLSFKTGLVNILSRDEVTAEDIRKHFEAHKPVMEVMAATLAESLADFYNMLTSEQRAKLAAALQSHAGGCRFGRHW